jgi:hypothetical protein
MFYLNSYTCNRCGKGLFFWIDGKRRIPISQSHPGCIQEKHGRAGRSLEGLLLGTKMEIYSLQDPIHLKKDIPLPPCVA